MKSLLELGRLQIKVNGTAAEAELYTSEPFHGLAYGQMMLTIITRLSLFMKGE
jgi:hypothetical protein